MGMSKTDQFILQGIVNDMDKVKVMNIHQLSKALLVSSSALSKACKKFGFEGYKEMQNRIKFEDDYKQKNIIQLIKEVNEIFAKEPFQKYSSPKDWHIATHRKIHEICCRVDQLPSSSLQFSFFGALTRILFYLTIEDDVYKIEKINDKALGALNEFGVLVI